MAELQISVVSDPASKRQIQVAINYHNDGDDDGDDDDDNDDDGLFILWLMMTVIIDDGFISKI